MTQELIPVRQGQIGGVTCHVVDGRHLHGFLGVRSQFGHWMTNRIRQYGFTKDVDFTLVKISQRRSHARGAATSYSYDLTLDTAKELAMVERNEKGREARRYFIECERRLTSALVPTSPDVKAIQEWLITKVLPGAYVAPALPDIPRLGVPMVRTYWEAQCKRLRERHREDQQVRRQAAANAADLTRRLANREAELLSVYPENRELHRENRELRIRLSVLGGAS